MAQVEGLVAQQPVLMAWEDVHWTDLRLWKVRAADTELFPDISQQLG